MSGQNKLLKVNMDDTKIKQILVDEGYVSAEDMAHAETAAADQNISIADALIAAGIITHELLGQALAESFGIPYYNLGDHPLVKEEVLKVPEDIAVKLRVLLIKETSEGAVFTTDSPHKMSEYGEVAALFPNRKLGLNYSTPEDIDAGLTLYRKTLETRFADIIKSEKRVAPEIIDAIFTDALSFNASDIHFEPHAKEVVVRFRVDGVLQEAGRVATSHYENIVNRIKVMARLRIDQHASAQDGAIRYEHDTETAIDMRVSIVPVVDGEKIVIRLLSLYIQTLRLDSLGLSMHDQELLEKASRKPFGMILVTGPTGSGKTTTLYALLQTLNHADVNITTIEDPVEYKIPGINQIQVNPQTGLTFASGLRSIVRQDPNVVLVGEIRDTETAEIAVNAALTGHLLLSTFHANDAASTIPRMLDMGVEPYLLASTLDLIIAKRLVRKICESCRYSTVVSGTEIAQKYPQTKQYFTAKNFTLYQGKGCNVCNHTGFKGRIGIHETILISPALQDLIPRSPSSKQIWELAHSEGSHTLFEDGLEKVNDGITTIDELLRVANPQ